MGGQNGLYGETGSRLLGKRRISRRWFDSGLGGLRSNVNRSLFDPLALAERVREIVGSEDRRKYYRFRPAPEPSVHCPRLLVPLPLLFHSILLGCSLFRWSRSLSEYLT